MRALIVCGAMIAVLVVLFGSWSLGEVVRWRCLPRVLDGYGSF